MRMVKVFRENAERVFEKGDICLLKSAFITYGSNKEYTVWIKCSEIKLNVEILLPKVSRRNVHHRMTIRAVTEFECVRFVRIDSNLNLNKSLLICIENICDYIRKSIWNESKT